jgi:hypothetical protein
MESLRRFLVRKLYFLEAQLINIRMMLSAKRSKRNHSRLFCVLIVWTTIASPFAIVSARSWADIQTYHATTTIDVSFEALFVESNPLNTMAPTIAPTTSTPSSMPSRAPSDSPSLSPSQTPSVYPSGFPSETPDPYPPNDEPLLVERSYFNYNVTVGARYGPGHVGITQETDGTFHIEYKDNAWPSVEEPANSIWKEFTDDGWGVWKGEFTSSDPLVNRCANVGNQSPIDLVESGVACRESHEVRSLVSFLYIRFDDAFHQS